MEVSKLRNGLQVIHARKCRETFKKINLAEVCRQNEISPSTVRNVLAGKSPRLDVLEIALKAGLESVKAKDKNYRNIVDACTQHN